MTLIDSPPRPQGRPRSLTPAVQEIIVQAVKQGLYLNRACALADIDDSTLFRWHQEADKGDLQYQELFNAIKNAEAEHQARNLALIAAAAETPHYWGAAAWQLERRYQKEYALKPAVSLSSEGNIQVNIQVKVSSESGKVIAAACLQGQGTEARIVEGETVKQLPEGEPDR